MNDYFDFIYQKKEEKSKYKNIPLYLELDIPLNNKQNKLEKDEEKVVIIEIL